MHQLKKPFIYNLAVLVLICFFWLFQKQFYLFYFQLIIGCLIGSFILEIDHLLYWFINPEAQESQIGINLLKKLSFKKLIDFYQKTKPFHTSLVLHHIYTQICLVVLSFFIITSSDTYLARSIVFFANLTLFTKQFISYRSDKTSLQTWLFARLSQKLTPDGLKYYLILVLAVNIFFLVKMIIL